VNYVLKNSGKTLVTILNTFAYTLLAFFSVSSFDCH